MLPAEEHQRAAESSMEYLMLDLESLEDGIWVWDIATDGLFGNSRWLSMLGYAEGDIPTTRTALMLLCHPEEQAAIEADLQAHLEGRTPRFERELRLRRRDGTWVWMLARARIVARDAQGHPLRMVGTNVD